MATPNPVQKIDSFETYRNRRIKVSCVDAKYRPLKNVSNGHSIWFQSPIETVNEGA